MSTRTPLPPVLPPVRPPVRPPVLPHGRPSSRAATGPAVTGVGRYVEHVMGMPVSLALRGRHTTDRSARAAWDRVVDHLREVDRVFSTYRPDSWISRIARCEVDVVDAPPAVAEVLELADQAREQSGGAFDVTWTGPDGRDVLDPSGLVKGWAVEHASQALRELAETDFCLAAGGDMVCHVTAPDSPPWRIGIENPRAAQQLLAVIPVRNGAIATSGLTHRGAHIVDPRTGLTPTALASVTVVAPSLTWADIDATAAFVLGDQAPDWLATRPGRSGLVVWADGRAQTVGRTGAP